ncbi:cell wall-binding repeat-containing protein [Microbacterium gallinarum]|uniref:Cell wall-binding repeat-containing protein n=1 Tax=Microbacterium gallinarum TaxID=2762209 RepID=A0ABR8X1V9_9MICO|nr:cell wall-binding repeat-containing protein [Microbacterium gallinarum]MBD8023312.1 cell wall-binding repeat-containing protein [Microbacterium gallinarum]
MRSIRARVAIVMGAAMVASGLVFVSPAGASAVTAAELPAMLTTAAETTVPQYNRDRFEHWIDADGDGCNTRYEVLIEESTSPVTVGSGCSLTGGTWVSALDGATATTPAEIEIDHLVALAEAWRSGASAWTDAQRRDFANDLGVPYALNAASSTANQSKADHDPAEWMPSNAAYHCEYAISWSLMKYRWALAVDAAELAQLQTLLSGACGATEVTLPTVMAAEAPTPTPTTVIDPFAEGETRLAGADRYATALSVASRYQPGVPAVFVATGLNFPDALSAAAAAALVGGPLLLTPSATLPAAVKAEIQRLNPTDIYVVGGTGAVSAGVLNSLSTIAPTTRLGDADRYLTGLKIVGATFDAADTAFIATGRGFPDALAATGAAGALKAPVILVDGTKSSVPSSTLAELARLGVQNVALVGSSSAVSSGIQSQLASAGYSVARYGGADRYATAAAINDSFFGYGSTDTLFLATGGNFPDALAGAAMAGRLAAPLYITSPGCVPTSVRESISQLGATKNVILGSASVVSSAAASNTGCLTSSIPTISGTAKVGYTLTANAGSWTPGAALAYQWYANGSALGGGTSLKLTAAHQGKKITVRVTGSLSGYVTVAHTSRATASVAAAAVAPPPAPAPPRYPNAVTPGAFCAKQYAGWIAYTVTGVKMMCKTSATDTRLRWRAA